MSIFSSTSSISCTVLVLKNGETYSHLTGSCNIWESIKHRFLECVSKEEPEKYASFAEDLSDEETKHSMDIFAWQFSED